MTLNPTPARVLGHPQLTLKTANPNLVEGRELYDPRSLAVDTTTSPPILYVADTLNNRVLGWRNATQFANGAFADIVIGQKDLFTTFPQGPGAELSGGLSYPTSVAVDQRGNLFVADAGNNRILRYPRPLDNPVPALPDLVIGQTTVGARTANNDPDTHTVSARTLALLAGATVYGSLLMDANGNMFVSDGGNRRVLRYPASLIGPGASNGPAADMVFGQPAFTVASPPDPASIADLTRLYFPSGLGMDTKGRLYVCDAAHRVLVYLAPLFSGGAATRMIGGVLSAQGTILQPPDMRSLNSPEDIFFVGDIPYVLDGGNNRILRFKSYENWPADPNTPPMADADGLIGQATLADYKPNQGGVQPVMGTAQNPAVSFNDPASAVRAGGELFVADGLNHRVIVLPDPATTAPANLYAKRVLGQQSMDTNGLNLIEGREFFFGSGGGVTVDTRSSPPRLYVADTVNNRVLGFKDARVARPGDRADLVIGQPDMTRWLANYPTAKADQPSRKSLYQPTGLAVDLAGNLYVADTFNGRVLRFPRPFDHGNYPDADLVLGKSGFTTALDTGADASPTNMGFPYGLAFSSDGNLLVSDLLFNRVVQLQKPAGGDFTSGMAANRVIGQNDFFSRVSGSTNNRLNGPHHISTDTNDTLFVCDTGNNRVQAYDSVTWKVTNGPNASLTLTSAGDAGNLSAPQGIFVSPVTGEIWVASSGGQYILRYPQFTTLVVNPRPDFYLPSAANIEHPLALTVDAFSNLLVVFSTNRLGFYFPAATAVNAASYMTRVAPGMWTALYPMGFVFGDQTATAPTVPLPTVLADLQVLVNDQPAPLLFVSPGQINYIMPMGAPTSGNVEVQLVRRSLGQILAVGCAAVRVAVNPDRYTCSGPLQMDVASPAMFAGASYSTGTGQIAALNVRADGTYYGVNSATNPVSRSDFVEIYGTGQGQIPNPPVDGAAPGSSPLYWTPGPKPQVIVNVAAVPDGNVSFSGLNPSLPGTWQVNVKIPDTTPPGNAIQVVIVHKGIPSNDPQNPGRIVTTIAVKQ